MKAAIDGVYRYPYRINLYPGTSCMFSCLFCGRNYDAVVKGKHPNIFKKFFIHEFFGKTQLLTNEDFDSNDGFYLIFFIALVSKLIIILNTLYKDKIVVEDFIEVISLVARYYCGKDNLDKEEKELVSKDNQTFVNLFYLFFG